MNRFLSKGEKLDSNTRPDVGFRTSDKKLHQVEVPSKTDAPDKLLERMKNTRSKLPADYQGKNRISEIAKEKK